MTKAGSPFEVLQAYLEARAAFTADEFSFMRTQFVPRGCLRSFVIDARGKEHVVQFAPEEWWLADAISLNTGTASQYFFAAIEETDLLLIDVQGQQQIVDRVPGYSQAMRTGLQKHAAAKDIRIVKSLSASAEERYLDFMQTFPTVARRVPQWMLASYLGVSPETVSRIRKQLSRK
jgi:CRP-like cAMP-binding protein